jgi:methylmalonyl-CoA mutase
MLGSSYPMQAQFSDTTMRTIENDCHAISVSTLAAGHKTLVPALVKTPHD